MTEVTQRYRAIRLVLLIMLWLTLFVLSVKVSVGWTTRSLSVLAESLHTLISSFSALNSLLATSATDRPMGREIYGHGKRETILTLLLTGFLGFACINLLWMTANQFIAANNGKSLPFPINASLPLIGVLVMMVATSLGLAFLGLYEARMLNSPSLRFSAGQILKDVGLSILVLGGLAAVFWNVIWLDLLLAILLVILAVFSNWQVLNWHLPLLVQQSAIAPDVLAQIARHVGGVTHCYRIRSKGIVGRMVYVQMYLILHPDFREVTATIAERIEVAIQERFGPVKVTFYIEEDVLMQQPPTDSRGRNNPGNPRG